MQFPHGLGRWAIQRVHSPRRPTLAVSEDTHTTHHPPFPGTQNKAHRTGRCRCAHCRRSNPGPSAAARAAPRVTTNRTATPSAVARQFGGVSLPRRRGRPLRPPTITTTVSTRARKSSWRRRSSSSSMVQSKVGLSSPRLQFLIPVPRS